MFHVHFASKLLAVHAAKDGKPKVENCSNQLRRFSKRSSDEAGSNRGSTTVANAAKGTSSSYVEDMYQLWLKDKTAVHSSWDNYFTNLQAQSNAPKSSLSTTSIAASHDNKKPRLDKDQLVQFVKPKATATSATQGTRKNKVIERTIGETEGPIVIKIDIISDPESDARSVKSGKSVESVRSAESIPSVQSTQPGPSSEKKIAEVKSPQRSPEVGRVQPSISTSPRPSVPSKQSSPQFATNQAQSGSGKPSTSAPKVQTPSVPSAPKIVANTSKQVNTNANMKNPPIVKPIQGTSAPPQQSPSAPKPNRQTTIAKPPSQVSPAVVAKTPGPTKPVGHQAPSPIQQKPKPVQQQPQSPVRAKPTAPTAPSTPQKPSISRDLKSPPSTSGTPQATPGSTHPQRKAETPVRTKPTAPTAPSTPQNIPISRDLRSRPSTSGTPQAAPGSTQPQRKAVTPDRAKPTAVTALTAPQNIPISRDLRSRPGTSSIPQATPKRTQPQQKADIEISPKAIPPNEVNDWRSHVVQFLRTYHMPTGGEAPRLPEFGAKAKPPPPAQRQPAGLRSQSTTTIKTDVSRSIRSAPRSRSLDSSQTDATAANVQASGPLSKQTPSPPGGAKSGASVRASSSGGATDNIAQHLAVQGVIRSYQTRGHLIATVDPLGILGKDLKTLEERKGWPPTTITRQHTALQGIDPNTKFRLPATTFIGQGQAELPLKDIIARLEAAYCHHIGVEFMYIQDMKKSLWIREYMESPKKLEVDAKTKRLTLQRLIQAVHLELFLGKKYPNDKRFGLEGGETAVPCIKQIIDTGTDMGIDGINISMAHRGRVNVLANVCRKSMKDIFTAFRGLEPEEEGSGDVKYHLGTVVTRENSANKKKVRIAVLANPSHLETVTPVGLGKTRCEQFLKGDREGNSIMALFVHGDSAFCGQGVVYESIHLTHLPCYTTRGTIHIVINNQVGFTTDPRFYKSSPYCTDVGRVVLAPIFHVNGDDPEAVVNVAKMAMMWRQTFHEDVVIDIVSYRRRGHNEQDEPMFTQPLMYQIIGKRPHIAQLYGEKLIKEGVVTQEEIDSYIKAYLDNLEKDHASAGGEKKMRLKDWLESPWKGFFKKYKFDKFPDTGVSEDILAQIGTKFSSPPPADFKIHRGIQRILKIRAKMVKERVADWSLGEAFAYASLMKDGYHVRLSGEDAERGTFSHRHHILHHQTEDMKTYNMLENIFQNQAPYTVCNSSLSEYGVMGFELGYSLVSPYMLVMWEAQFGDFADTGQTMFDTYIANGQSKWFRQCGLVVQLPHGLEGAGPEHSSARLERFLQMCDDDVVTHANFDEKFVLHQHEACNWFVANCTTPANLFHVLRRQLLLPFRKPLILMTPKGFLRHPKAKSTFDEFLPGQMFRRVIPDAGPASKAPDQVKKLIFCTGRTYYEIMSWIEEAKAEATVAVTRTEQISPFPYDLVAAEIKKYPNAKVCWAQEEHMNQGGWMYVHERIGAASGNKVKCEYHGRSSSSAAATGSKITYQQEVQNYKQQVLS